MQDQPVSRPGTPPGTSQSPVWLVLLSLLCTGIALRLLRLEWQPLWWDEGYTIYFATEPLARMAWLTARDIHPPLYFALAHVWVMFFSSFRPETFRLLSVLLALPAIPFIALLAHHIHTRLHTRHYPPGMALILTATALSVINPMHLYYSQEIRMYGLALSLTLAATLTLFAFWARIQQNQPAGLPALLYALFAGLSLYTLYYSALLIAAHFAWLLYAAIRTKIGLQLRQFVPFLATFALFAPWLLFTIPELLPYIIDKVASDQDTPLNLFTYITTHWIAFTGGHLNPNAGWLNLARLIGLAAPVACLLILLYQARRPARSTERPAPSPHHAQIWLIHALWIFLLMPVVLGYMINLIYPFFPTGGERLLFISLPYFLLLISVYTLQIQDRRLRVLPPMLLLISGVTGIYIFYTLPRYANDDYRPIVQAVSTGGRNQDTVLALFPWQIGYWRAYSPVESGTLLPPQPHLLDQEALEWNESIRRRIDSALAQGTLWFPAPLGFGSTLPHEIEAYLIQGAANVDERWFSPTTLLSAWVPKTSAATLENSTTAPGNVLQAVHMQATPQFAANTPLPVRLIWQESVGQEHDPRVSQRVHLRLRSEADQRIWYERSYEPLGRYAQSLHNADQSHATTGIPGIIEDVGILIPVGLPPGAYRLELSIDPITNIDLRSDDRSSLHDSLGQESLIYQTPLQVAAPDWPVSPLRLPVARPVEDTTAQAGLTLYGLSNVPAQAPLMAGTTLSANFQLAFSQTAPDNLQLIMELRASNGDTVAHTAAWPLPHHPPSAWPPGTLLTAPMQFFIPATVAANDDYTLWAGLGTADEQAASPVARVAVFQRERNFTTPPTSARPLPTPIQFGTHVQLLGYSHTEDDSLTLTLDWQVLDTLLPPHHIFVHWLDENGQVVGQSDGQPAATSGPAPTGSWLSGEYLTTQHHIPLPPTDPVTDSLPGSMPVAFRVGLYIPATGVRLPATQNSESTGDYAELAIP